MGHVLMKETIAFLTFMSFWPKTKKSSKILPYFILFLSSFLLFGSVSYLVVYRKFGKFRASEPQFCQFFSGSDDIDTIETITSQFGVLYFIALFMWKREGMVKIVALLSDFSKFGQPRFFDKRNRQLSFFLKYCIIVLTVCIGGVLLCPVIFSESCEKINQETNRTKVCGVVSNVWAPFDYSEFPLKQVVIIWETCSCFVNLGCAGVMSFTIIETMEHLIIRIEQLKDMFSDVINEDDIAMRQEKLKMWVNYHLHLFDIGQLMTDTYRYSLSVIVLCVGILFSCCGISMMQSLSSHGSIFLFLGWLQSIGILCVCGQRLLDTCLSVGDLAYHSVWYEKDVAFQKALLMIIIRARRPILIYAGPFSYLSYVLQTAYSYINLLKAT
ncbi:putative odorant receptor 69a isoform X2 [Tribolium madens]|uniref:putative odorant receptor 69a isoform X2 n=1 Tax=Tribolium madens TaxID=41895 RepID=UPI001CF7600D|nr:putative odorant receptor 69a isoform X2 [Tribolium madens]